ncbi:MAG: hypothetical protein ACKVVP_15040 [Chloroflexota bacterium]
MQISKPAGQQPLSVQVSWLGILGLLLLAFTVRFWGLRDQLFIHADDAWHIVLIQRFARDNILDYSQARPMYPYLLGLMARLADNSYFFPSQVSAVSGGVLALVILYWTHARAGLLAGISAGLLVAVSPLEIYFSKTSGPITPATLVMTLSTVALALGLESLMADRRVTRGSIAFGVAAGILAGLAVTIHRAFLPVPFFMLGFLGLVLLQARHRRVLTFLGLFVLGALVPVFIAQIVTERYQPPSVNHFGYLNQLRAALEQQRDWRSGPGGRGWWFYLVGFWETEGLLAAVLAVGGTAFGAWRWLHHRDWWSGLLVWLVVTTFGYASLVSAGGGITVLRAVAPALPLISILSGIAFARWCQAVAGFVGVRAGVVQAVALATLVVSGIFLAWPVINARTGFTSAMEIVRNNDGFAASFDDDPWRVLTAPRPLILVGPKRQDRSPVEMARDQSLVAGPCHLLLEHYELWDDRLILGGLADLSLSELGTPLAVIENTRDILTPARVEFGDVPYAAELRVYLEPPVCRELEVARTR